ncbi:MAG: hypothetical protein AB4372_33145 [Xenococcus sp. (in: cyanobacteria)]
MGIKNITTIDKVNISGSDHYITCITSPKVDVLNCGLTSEVITCTID